MAHSQRKYHLIIRGPLTSPASVMSISIGFPKGRKGWSKGGVPRGRETLRFVGNVREFIGNHPCRMLLLEMFYSISRNG